MKWAKNHSWIADIQRIPPDNARKVSSNATRRVFGIIETGAKSGAFTQLAYRAHSGVAWEKISHEKREQHFRRQLHGGRALEVVVCEELIRWGHMWFHFLPTKEFDMSYKTDLISRFPYIVESPDNSGKRLRTFSIGSQLTLMELPENIKGDDRESEIKRENYSDKLDQVRQMNKYLHIPLSRRELKWKYGKLTLPDIMAFIAVNGEFRKTLWNNSGYTYLKFKEWEERGFPHSWLGGEFKERLRNTLHRITLFIAQTQQYIFSDEFLLQDETVRKKWFEKEINDGEILYNFDGDTQELDCYMYNVSELVVKITYLFIRDDLDKLRAKKEGMNSWKNREK